MNALVDANEWVPYFLFQKGVENQIFEATTGFLIVFVVKRISIVQLFSGKLAGIKMII